MSRGKLLKAKEVWQQAEAVCFDVDSTLIREEGIDGLAEFCGAGFQVKEWWVSSSQSQSFCTCSPCMNIQLNLFYDFI